MLDHFGDVCRVAVPMFLYFMIMWTATLLVTRKFHSTYEQCVTQVSYPYSETKGMKLAVISSCRDVTCAATNSWACADAQMWIYTCAELHCVLQQL